MVVVGAVVVVVVFFRKNCQKIREHSVHDRSTESL